MIGFDESKGRSKLVEVTESDHDLVVHGFLFRIQICCYIVVFELRSAHSGLLSTSC